MRAIRRRVGRPANRKFFLAYLITKTLAHLSRLGKESAFVLGFASRLGTVNFSTVAWGSLGAALIVRVFRAASHAQMELVR
jgi:hypothetical protein